MRTLRGVATLRLKLFGVCNMALSVFRFFSRPRCSAMFTNVPISLLDEFRSVYPGKYRIRYRGPRAHRTFDSSMNRASYCLKRDAKTFSAYLY